MTEAHSTSANGSYGKRIPVQRRSKEVVERILESTHALLNEISLAELTMQGVAERAGVSVGAIYRYHADKMDLIRAVQDRTLRVLEKVMVSRIATAPPTVEGVVTALVDSFDTYCTPRAKEFHAFIFEGALDPILFTRGQESLNVVFVAFYASLNRDAGRVSHENFEDAARIAFDIVVWLFGAYSRDAGETRSSLLPRLPDRNWFATEARRAAIAYLTYQPLA